MAAEDFEIGLKLVNGVTGPGEKAAKTLDNVKKKADEAAKALDFSKTLGKAEATLKKLEKDPGGFVALKKAQREIREKQSKLLEDAGMKHKESFFGGLFKWAQPYGAGRVFSATMGELVADGIEKGVDALMEGVEKAADFFADQIKDAFSAAGKEQTLRVGEKNVLGGGAKEFREDAEKFAKLTPFNDSEIRAMMLPLRRAGLSQAASRQAFATATDIGGSNPEAVGGVLEQFKRIYTKQGIGKRQLVELLGNVGTTIPDFYKELGKRMHISAKEAEKKAESGGLDPQLLMNMITEAQNKKQGGAAGTGGKNFADTLEVRWKKIKDLPEEFYKKFVDSPSFARANAALGQFLEQLSPESPAGQRIMASLDKMFGRIGDLLANPEGTVDGLVDGLENAIGLFEQILPSVKEFGYGIAVAAESMAEIVTGARVYAALLSGNKEEAGRIANEQINAKKERMAARFREQNEASEKRRVAASVALGIITGGMAGTPVMQSSAPQKGGKVTHLHVHPGAVTVHAAPGEDPTHAHHEAGEKLKRHVQGALEQAAQEAGG